LDRDAEALDLIPDNLVLRVTIVHLSSSRIGVTSAPTGRRRGEGLSAFGRDFVQHLNARRIFVDLAHINRQGFFDAVAVHDRSQPLLVTKEEIANVQKLDMWLDVNGEKRQRGNTRTMVFGCANLVSYISQFMTLLPGDIITTGTPPGVGLGMKPPQYLKPGDVITLGISGLGEQRQRVVAYSGK
jgi:hypothetical protein